MTDRQKKVAELVQKTVAGFLAKNSNQTSLITVTSVSVSPDLKRATAFITVLPESKETPALNFAKRQKGEIRELLKKNIKTKVIPFLEIEIDKGEKNRQKIEKLLNDSS